MRFDRPQRVVYEQNPLAEVVCQIRFPRILQIDNELPVAFQNRIRSEYPIAQLEQPFLSLFGRVSPAPEPISASMPLPANERTFQFLSADKKWKASLSSGFIALTAVASYERWEGFRSRLEALLHLVQEIYEPTLCERIGLRYTDVIVRSELGLSAAQWKELVAPQLVSAFTTPPINEEDLVAGESLIVLRIEGGMVSIRVRFVVPDGSNETACVIDSDFFLEGDRPYHATSALATLDEFNAQAGGLFQWCITPRLHKALCPQPVR